MTVVATSGGYPGSYVKGKEISISKVEGVSVNHAGTKLVGGKVVTNGGMFFTLYFALCELFNAMFELIQRPRPKLYNNACFAT